MGQLRLSEPQLKTLVTIQIELGVIGIATVALPVFFDRGSWLVLILGILLAKKYE